MTPAQISAPTYPGVYIPGGGVAPAAVPIFVQPPIQQVPQQNVGAVGYPSQFTNQNLFYETVPVTYATVQTTTTGLQTGNVTVTYVQQYPITSHAQQTLPMPDVTWQRPRPTTQRSTFPLNSQLTGTQTLNVLSAEPTARQDPMISLLKIETSAPQPIVTQSLR